MESQLVSVIVLVYNTERYLKRCVDSIVNQTYKNLEIILLDDGSTDGSPDICDDYKKKDERIVVIHQKNAGLPEARNVGLNLARGEFVAFVDCDDLIRDIYIEKLVKAALKYRASIVQGRAYAFKNYHKIKSELMYNSFTNKIFVLSGKEMCHKLLYDKNANDYDCAHSKLYRREVFQGLRFPKGRLMGEDTAMAYLLFWNAETVVVIDEALYLYQSKRKDSITHAYKPQNDLDRPLSTRERMLFFKKEEKSELFYQSMYLHCNALMVAGYRLSKCGADYRDVVRSYRKELKGLLKDIVRADLTLKKKILVFLGSLSPSLWYRLWEKKNQFRKKKVWKEREK